MPSVRSVATNAGLFRAPPTYTVIVAGQALFVVAGSLQIQQTVGRRAQASFIAYTSTATHFLQYQQVTIYDRFGNLVFTGYVTQPKEQKQGFQPSLLQTITCTDQHYLADKRRVVASYVNKTVGFIAQDLLNNILSQEGVTVGQIYDGQTPSPTLYPSTTLFPGGNIGLIPTANFVYCTVAQALDELVKAASSSGVPYYWMIDQYKQLWVVPYGTVTNSTIVDGSEIAYLAAPTTVQRQNPTYRNTQYLLGGVQQTAQQIESRVGDGTTQSWTMGYALALMPAIKVNGTTQTVGIKGSSGKQFYWAAGDPIVTQDSAQTKLTSAQTLQVTYIGQYPAVVVDANQAQISYQAQIDGTSGIVEDVISDPTITSITNGLSETSQLLTRYADQGVQFVFPTLRTDFAPGQLITVNIPDHGFYNEQMLVSTVLSSDQIDQLNIYNTVTAVEGPYDTTWVDFFSALLKQAQPANSINVGVQQSIALLVAFTASLSLSLNATITVYACPVVSTTLFPNTTLYPC